MYNTGIPCFLKVHFTPLNFLQRQTLILAFPNLKKFRGFLQKAKIAFSVVLHCSVIQSWCAP